ncbi:NUDIX domain-containing protein [uncultured Ruminococcus sp.]|uniref:NUDIX domain-containing protein n=1 Tax=uncultured Ruminococcus sp. TaxID=165186 RepID=UPI00260EA9F9|nr:NUDIX domain-containing protein [uncultured Ruminococcus sp.]
MRNVMQEIEVPDWKERLAAYVPQDAQEQVDYEEICKAAEIDGVQILHRSRTAGHVTCSGFVMNPALDAVLMVYHNIYDSFAWTGGHADGSTDFLWTAVREAKEETGIRKPFPLSGAILSLDVLPVKAHVKNGAEVPAHVHYNVTYGLIADSRETISVKPDENQAVQWIPVEQLAQVCREPHMLPVYEKVIARMRACAAQQKQVMAAMTEPLLAWYPFHARDLLWRHDKEPYHVWLSEIMLQQTRVEAVKSYYQRFLEVFPDVHALAAATQDQVNKCWEGLGYYSRAANLRKAAEEIVETYHGSFPSTWEEVRSLPGVGDYTAGAICSICYELPTPAVDGNVLRVTARVTDNFCEIDRTERKEAVTKALGEVYQSHPGSCGMLTQALMELGATVCLPNGQPLCGECPLAFLCMARKNDDVMRLPQRTAKKPRKMEQYTVFVLCCDGKYAVRKRSAKGLLHGLWEYPNISGICTTEEAIAQVSAWHCQPQDVLQTVERRHIFTHVEWEMYGVYLTCARQDEQFVWRSAQEIAAEISLPTAFRQFMPK